MKNQSVTSFLSEYFQIFFGVVLASIGLKAFLLPNGFLDGGATGIAILINEISNIGISWLLLIISTPFLVIAWFTVSKKVVFKSVFSIIGLAIFIHFENFTSFTDDKLLIAIFGGLFLGAGIGLAVRNGAVLDGSEILGIFVNDRFGVSIGKVVLVFNVILFTITAFVLSKEIAMYSILTYLVTAKIIDLFIQGFEDYVGLMIVSRESEEIEYRLMERVGTGVTVYKGARGYGSKGKQSNTDIIHVIINRIDIRKTYTAIEMVDDDAFVVEFDVNNIKGGVHRKYIHRRGMKKLSPTVYPSDSNQQI